MPRIIYPNFSLHRYQPWLRMVSALPNAQPKLTPAAIINQATRYDQLDLPRGSIVIFRADIDGVDRGNGIFKEKLLSNRRFLEHAKAQGWRVIMMGHRRRPTDGDIENFRQDKIAEVSPLVLHHDNERPQYSNVNYLSEQLRLSITYARHWLTPNNKLGNEVKAWAESGTTDILWLENDRLWPEFYRDFNATAKKPTANLDDFAQTYYAIGKQLQEFGAQAYVIDASSAMKQACFTKAIAPFMPQIAIGPATFGELEKLNELLGATVVSIGGIKVSEKLPAAIEMAKQNLVHLIVTSGVVGIAFRYAELLYKGIIENRNDQLMGAICQPSAGEAYVSPEAIDEISAAYATLETQDRLNPYGPKGGVLNPVDFRLATDSRHVASFEPGYDSIITPEQLLFDNGPQSIINMNAAVRPLVARDPLSFLLGISGTPGACDKAGFKRGTMALSTLANYVIRSGGRVMAGGGEGGQVCRNAEILITGGAGLMFIAGTTPAAYRAILIPVAA